MIGIRSWTPSDVEEVKRIAINRGNDKVSSIFQDLCEKLVPSSPWQMFWETEQIEKFRQGKICKPTFRASAIRPASYCQITSIDPSERAGEPTPQSLPYVHGPRMIRSRRTVRSRRGS
jgi:hypothetical protein